MTRHYFDAEFPDATDDEIRRLTAARMMRPVNVARDTAAAQRTIQWAEDNPTEAKVTLGAMYALPAAAAVAGPAATANAVAEIAGQVSRFRQVVMSLATAHASVANAKKGLDKAGFTESMFGEEASEMFDMFLDGVESALNGDFGPARKQIQESIDRGTRLKASNIARKARTPAGERPAPKPGQKITGL